jgi:anti-sigma factor RsiW
VTQSGEHLNDEQISALIDAQLPPAEAALARTHVATCAVCTVRVDEMQALVVLLGALPSLDAPRDFRLPQQPRLVVLTEPPNVIRLRRWYSATRVGAASLAAAFVFLSVGTLYVDSRPPASTAIVAASRPASGGESAPQPNAVLAPTPASRAAAPAAPGAPAAGAAQSAPAIRSQSSADAADQQAAATTVRPLPPTPVPTTIVSPVSPFQTQAGQAPLAANGNPSRTDIDPAAPLRTAAVGVGLLAALTILAAILVRHRLRAASHLPVE